MAVITLTDDELQVRLTTGEKVGGLLRDLRVPRSAIQEVSVEPKPIRSLRGIRVGLGLPWRAIGTWRRKGRKTYVSVRARQPALRVTLGPPARFDELLVSSPDAEALARTLRS